MDEQKIQDTIQSLEAAIEDWNVTRVKQILDSISSAEQREEILQGYRRYDSGRCVPILNLALEAYRAGNDIKLIQHLLEAGVSVNGVSYVADDDGTRYYDNKHAYPLQLVTRSDTLLPLILQYKPDPTVCDGEKTTIVHRCGELPEKRAQMILDYCANNGHGGLINKKGYCGVMPLSSAKELSQTTLLVRYGADPDKYDEAVAKTVHDFLMQRLNKPEIKDFLENDPYRNLRQGLLRTATTIKAKPGNRGGFVIEGDSQDIAVVSKKIQELYATIPEQAGDQLIIDTSQGALRGFLTAMLERKQEISLQAGR